MLLGLLVNGFGTLGGEGKLFISVSEHLKASGPAPAPPDLHGPARSCKFAQRLAAHYRSFVDSLDPAESVVICIYYKWECDQRCSVDEHRCHFQMNEARGYELRKPFVCQRLK